MIIYRIIFVVVLIATVWFMLTEKKSTGNVVSQEKLSAKNKRIAWVLCILNPVIAGAILYYGWKKKLPAKAHQANQISLTTFFIELIVGLAVFFLF